MSEFGVRAGSVVRRGLLPVALVCAVAACGEDSVAPSTDPVVIPTPVGILDAPSELELDGHTYEIETYLWRDFMPISPPDGKPLTVLVRLVETGGLPVPGPVSVDTLWVVDGEWTWVTLFSDEARPTQPPHKREEIARDGPKWGPGVSVDVVVSMRSETNEPHRILASQQPIDRTE